MNSPELIGILLEIKNSTEQKEFYLQELQNIQERMNNLSKDITIEKTIETNELLNLDTIKKENETIKSKNTLLEANITELELISTTLEQDREKEEFEFEENILSLQKTISIVTDEIDLNHKNLQELEDELTEIKKSNEEKNKSILSSQMNSEIEKRFLK